MTKPDTSNISWYAPAEPLPDKGIIISNTQITFPRDMLEKLPDKRVAIGISKARCAIFIKPDKGGYRLRLRKNGRSILTYKSLRFEKALLHLTKGERVIVEPSTMSDGTFGCFL